MKRAKSNGKSLLFILDSGADEDSETRNSCLNNRQEMLHGNERYSNKKVNGKARTCNTLGRTQVLNWLSYFSKLEK